MRKSIFLGLALMIGMIANAQSGEVTNAVLYHKNNDLVKAKSAIDNATKHDKTSAKSKTWYYTGVIYMDIAKKKTDFVKKHANFSTAAEAFQKAIDLNNSENFVSQATKKREELYGTVFNEGVALHGANDLENAMNFDELAASIQIPNTENRVSALINASIAAESLKNVDKGIELNKKILELAPNDFETYLALIKLYETKKDMNMALKYAEDGAEKFPENKDFNNEVARIAVKSGNADQAIKKLKEASAKEPSNTLYLNKIAELYDKTGDKKEAENYYLKAVATDTKNVDANYNLGAFYFNEAVEHNNKLGDLDLNASTKTRTDLNNKMKASFNKCIPYYEAAYPQLTPAERENLKPSLMKAYIKVGRDEDADKL